LASVVGTFLRGYYDTAVFQAFKEVEVAVRTAAKLSDADFGVALMRKAFDKDTGPLADQSRLPTERKATAHLFAGAIGLFKNAHSHRNVVLNDPRRGSGNAGPRESPIENCRCPLSDCHVGREAAEQMDALLRA
jgi:uncharacterized protein (TIGR02391 family)